MVRIWLLVVIALCLPSTVSALEASINPAGINGSFSNENTNINLSVIHADGQITATYVLQNGTEYDVSSLLGKIVPLTSFLEDPPECQSYMLHFRVNDTNSTRDVQFMTTYDMFAPTAPIITQPAEGSVYNNTFRVSWTASTDTCSGLRSPAYSLLVSCPGYTDSLYTDNLTALLQVPDGDCNLTVEACDNVETIGSSNKAASSKTFKVITTGPEIQIGSPETRIYRRDVPFSVILDRIGSCRLQNSTGIFEMQTADGLSFVLLSWVQEGPNTANIHCNDTNGLHSNKSVSFTADVTPPNKAIRSVSGSTSSPYAVNKTVAEIFAELNEAGSCRLSTENKSFNNMITSSDTACNNINASAISCNRTVTNGNHNFYLACSDGYNNDTSLSTSNISVIVNVYNNMTIEVENDGYVRAGNTRDYLIRISNTGYGNITNMNFSLQTAMESGWFNLSKGNISLLETGKYVTTILTVKPAESATNNTYSFTLNVNSTQLNRSAGFSIVVRSKEDFQSSQTTSQTSSTSSASGPKIKEMKPTGYANSRTVNVNIVTDEKSSCRMDGINTTYDKMSRFLESGSDGINHALTLFGLPSGKNTFYVLCKDAQGNVMPNADIMTFTVDVGPPVTKVKQLSEYQEDSRFQVSWEGNDDISGIKSYTVQVRKDSGEWEYWIGPTEKENEWFDGEEGRTYDFRSIGTDNAGNVETKVSVISDAKTRVQGALIETGADNVTGLAAGDSIIDLTSMSTTLSNFLSKNAIPLLVVIAVVIGALAMSKRPKTRTEKSMIRKNVFDDWRKIKESLKHNSKSSET